MSSRSRAGLPVMVVLVLIAASLSCTLKFDSNEPTPTPTITLTPTISSVPTFTQEPSTESTGEDAAATPQTTPGDDCTYDADFVTDVSIPDGTEIGPGEAFNKTWRLKNTGCLDWPAGTKLVFSQGDQMGGPSSVDVPATAINGQQDITVGLIGPSVAGIYRGYWQLKAPNGILFGPRVYVEIEVPAVGLPIASGPDLVIRDISTSTSLLWAGTAFTMNITVKNRGDTDAPASQVGCLMEGMGAGSTVAVPAIPAGGTAVVQCGYTLVKGEYTFQAIADTTAVIAESDEGNNSRLYDLTVGEISLIFPSTIYFTFGPDLVITGVTFLSNNSRMQVFIKNQGNAPSPATVVFCSAEDPGGSGDGGTAGVPAIAAGATHVMDCLSLPSGMIVAHYFAHIDPNDTVSETNEDNNTYED